MRITVRVVTPDPTIPGDEPKIYLEFDSLGYICSIDAAMRLMDNLGKTVEEAKQLHSALLRKELTDLG
jgi:hypothetical protein